MSRRWTNSPEAIDIPFDGAVCDPSLNSTDVQGAICELVQGPTGKLMDFIFVASGNTANKWLGVGNGSTSSDTLPLIMPQDGEIIWTTFSNQDDDVDIDVEFYVNGTLSNTWEIRNKRTAWKTDFSNGTISQGDRVSCFLKKYEQGTGDQTAQDPIIEVFFRITSDMGGEGGTVNGV